MKYIEDLVNRYPDLYGIKNDIIAAYEIIRDSYINKGKLLVGGNGGSAADSEHIVGELMKGFMKKRTVDKNFSEKLIEIDEEKGEKLSRGLQGALEAIAITGHLGLSTAFANDVDPDLVLAQQVYGYGRQGDVLFAISTSGNSKNLHYAVITARAKGMKVILLGGKDGGLLKKYTDVSIIVPSYETFMIQERHLPIYHALCLELENYFYDK